MTTQIGKYIVSEDDRKFAVSYKYTFSDLTGSFWFILMFLFGLFLLFIFYKTFTINSLYSFDNILFGLISLSLLLIGAYFIALGLHNPKNGIFRIDKLKQELTIVDFLKSETIPLKDLSSVYHEIKTSYKPRMKYAVLCIRLTNGKTKECFIIRSKFPIDLGREVDKDIHLISRQLIGRIHNSLNGLEKLPLTWVLR